jgi:DNA invertase Pin-like site-specific DNA recombinase
MSKIALRYLRVSDRHQVTGDGYDRQREAIERWRRSRNDEVQLGVEFYDSHTGTDFERPGLGSLLEHIRDAGSPGHILVVVERSDRLARDVLASELILQEFRSLGVQVWDAEANLELTHDDEPSKVLVRQMLQAISQFEKSSIVRKLRRARERKRAGDGRCEGAKPFGHYEEERNSLNAIQVLHAAGVTAPQMADRLNRWNRMDGGHGVVDILLAPWFGEKLLPRSGKNWNRRTLGRITSRLREEGR